MTTWLEMRDPNYYRKVSRPTTDQPVRVCSIDEPAPCVMAGGMRSSTPYIVRGIMARAIHDTGGSYGAGDVTDSPCPTITSGGLVSNAYHFFVEREDGETTIPPPPPELMIDEPADSPARRYY